MSFAVSIFGTFLVRSSIISSVHSFAADPKRGLFLLIFLLFVVPYGLYLLIKVRFQSIQRKKLVN